MARLSEIQVKVELRPVEVHSHQFYIQGYFHRYMDQDGKTFALVEGKNGKLTSFDLSYHRLEFKDR